MVKLMTLVWATFVVAAVEASVSIEVFTHYADRVAKVPGYSIQVHDLSAPKKIATPKFSANETVARREAVAWLKSQAGQQHIQNVRQAHSGHTKAMKYQLKKIPAVVFNNGTHVVYGTTDVRKALQDYYQKGI